MIQIIERGTKEVTTCNRCGCKFSYEAEDISYDVTNPDPRLVRPMHYVQCPQCMNHVTVGKVVK